MIVFRETQQKRRSFITVSPRLDPYCQASHNNLQAIVYGVEKNRCKYINGSEFAVDGQHLQKLLLGEYESGRILQNTLEECP